MTGGPDGDPARCARGGVPNPEIGREVLAGLVERVTFHNPENGFCVLRIKARGRRDLVTKVIPHWIAVTSPHPPSVLNAFRHLQVREACDGCLDKQDRNPKGDLQKRRQGQVWTRDRRMSDIRWC